MENHKEKNKTEAKIERSIKTALRIGFIALLFVMSFWILKPFLLPVIWGIIIAVALFPLHKKLSKLLGNREKLSVTIIVLIGILIIVVPSGLFISSTIDSLKNISHQLSEGTLTVPSPDESVADWPVIGGMVYETWELASESLAKTVTKFAPQLKELAPGIFSFAAGLVGTVVMFIISLIISGAFLVNTKSAEKTAVSIFRTLAGPDGEHFASLAGATIRGVVQGVLGTALIQSFFIGIGLMAIGFPAAGVVALVVLIVAIVQLPVLLVMIPAIIYVFSYAGTTAAIVFTIWVVVWSIADNFIKPILMGRGVDIPMLVILVGAIGGMMMAGIIGLFLGAVLLAFAYKVFQVIFLSEGQEAVN
jgi:predicted PurR-regulated permease PerM